MEALIKFLKSFGLSDQEIKKVLQEVPVDQKGFAGTNITKGIFEKGGKQVSADFPLVTETMVSPFKLDKYKGLSKKEALEKADEALKYLDKELTRTSNLIINQNLQLAPEQKINFSNNLRMKREFEKEVEAFKTQPEAKIIQLETKQPVSKEGIEQLIENAGQVSPPGTLAGDIETRVNRLKAIADKKGMNVGEILKETGEAQVKYAAGNDIGLVRSVARQIMFNDIKSGKLKAPKEIQDIVSGASNIDVIEPFRNIYGENALEQLDSLIPDFKNVTTEIEAEKLARSKYEFTPNLDRPKESYTPEEMKKILDTEPEDKFAKGGKAESKGLDYLMGIDRNYATGGMVERENYAFGSLLKRFISQIKDVVSPVAQPTTTSAPEVPLTVQERYNKYLSQPSASNVDLGGGGLSDLFRRLISKFAIANPQTVSTNDQLYNLYRSGVEGKANGGRIGYAEGSEDAPSITLDSYEKAPDNIVLDSYENVQNKIDNYPIKIGNLELGTSGYMTSGANYQPNPYNKTSTANRNFSVRGKYNIPDTGVSILGDVGDVRIRNTRDINVPQYDYKETIKDVIKARPYSVGIEYTPDQNKNINLRYDDQGNVSLRGEYKFAKGGLGYLMGE
jgi:hypothetical protein